MPVGRRKQAYYRPATLSTVSPWRARIKRIVVVMVNRQRAWSRRKEGMKEREKEGGRKGVGSVGCLVGVGGEEEK